MNIGFGLAPYTLTPQQLNGTTLYLHYKLLSEGTFDTMDLIYYYLTPWLTKENIQRWASESVFDDELGIIASDIDKLYAYVGSTWFKGELKNKWVIVEITSSDLLNYGLKYWGFGLPETKQDRDDSAVKKYTLQMRKTHPPPIILGASLTRKPELLDGMHRIYAANVAGVKSLRAFVPEDGLKWLVKL